VAGRRAFVAALVAAFLPRAAAAQPTRRPARKEDSTMPDEIASELRRLRLNQAALMAALNRVIADTAPVRLANPADGSAGYVTTGLVLDADGLIVPGTIPAPAPQLTSRGVRPGDPLWVETPGTP
jgi:hypothetical protein